MNCFMMHRQLTCSGNYSKDYKIIIPLKNTICVRRYIIECLINCKINGQRFTFLHVSTKELKKKKKKKHGEPLLFWTLWHYHRCEKWNQTEMNLVWAYGNIVVSIIYIIYIYRNFKQIYTSSGRYIYIYVYI